LKRPRPTEHLAFNKGPRMCVGASLARAEISGVVNAVLDRFSDIRLDPDAAPPSFLGHVNRSFRPLNVLLTAR
jgi:cytochrome P450